MHPRILSLGFSIFVSSLLLFTLNQGQLSVAIAEVTPTKTTPTGIALPSSSDSFLDLFANHPQWLRIRIRSNGALTTTIKLPQDTIDPLCTLHLEFSPDQNFLAQLGEFSLGAANFTRGAFTTRMNGLPEAKGGKTIKRIYTRGVLYCPPPKGYRVQIHLA